MGLRTPTWHTFASQAAIYALNIHSCNHISYYLSPTYTFIFLTEGKKKASHALEPESHYPIFNTQFKGSKHHTYKDESNPLKETLHQLQVLYRESSQTAFESQLAWLKMMSFLWFHIVHTTKAHEVHHAILTILPFMFPTCCQKCHVHLEGKILIYPSHI